MNKSVRLFFAVNLPESLKEEIAKLFLGEIPRDKWRLVLSENLHITLCFLGYCPEERIAQLQEKAAELQSFPAFKAELNGIGHFKGRVLWIGVGKGSDELNVLGRKVMDIAGVHDDRFHAHVTLGRNKGMRKQETDALIEGLRENDFKREISVESFELMSSQLRKQGPLYKKVFSVKLGPAQ